MKELYKRYRPKKLKQVVGQDEIIGMLTSYLKKNTLPHSLLLHGASGCGKTTIARILQSELNCSNSDFTELNAASSNGIDAIRSIGNHVGLSPMGGGSSRIWLIDEAHELTKAAQNAFLKMLEDTPEHAYFILATTNPKKLLPTIRNRCCDLVIRPLDSKTGEQLLNRICKKEDCKLHEDVKDKILEYAEGSARKMLVMLDSVITLASKKEQLNILVKDTDEKEGIDIARMFFNKSSNWKSMSSALKALTAEPETVRYIVLSYATSVLLSSGNGRAALVIEEFSEPFYNSGKAGLALACFNVLNN